MQVLIHRLSLHSRYYFAYDKEMAKSEQDDNLKQMSLTASNSDKIIPKLASKVLLGSVGTNTLLTFVMDTGAQAGQLIETIAIDKALHEQLIKLLERELKAQKELKK